MYMYIYIYDLYIYIKLFQSSPKFSHLRLAKLLGVLHGFHQLFWRNLHTVRPLVTATPQALGGMLGTVAARLL